MARASDPPYPDDVDVDVELDAAFARAIDEPATELAGDEAPAEPDDAAADVDREPLACTDAPAKPRQVARNVHERLRGLNLNEQIRMAQTGETHERVVLERMYGKTVWEALLRNPRLTGPEVARIARMGALPKVLLELILGNGTWLHIPEVRRALLASKRLGTDQIVKVLRFLPRHELKLATVQTAYPAAVRDAARRLLRGED